MSNWNAEIIEQLVDEKAPSLVVRTCQRLSDKGFDLNNVQKEKGHEEGFNWGRSSHGVTRKFCWVITFDDAAGVERLVNVSCATTTYTKCNPYDRLPKDNGKESAILMATDDVKSVLGWKKAA